MFICEGISDVIHIFAWMYVYISYVYLQLVMLVPREVLYLCDYLCV